jgi:hypothetical protein
VGGTFRRQREIRLQRACVIRTMYRLMKLKQEKGEGNVYYTEHSLIIIIIIIISYVIELKIGFYLVAVVLE